MQSFLPYSDFIKSAKVLDYRRCGKQRIEALQMIQAMDRTEGGWINHPCTKMWSSHPLALAAYGLVMCNEWVSRGYKDTMTERFENMLGKHSLHDIEMPDWLGNDDIHASHRSNLLRKDPVYYGQFKWSEPDDLPYVWPVN